MYVLVYSGKRNTYPVFQQLYVNVEDGRVLDRIDNHSTMKRERYLCVLWPVCDISWGLG